MWLGEQITEFGIGNGISIILFANIISRLPSGIGTLGSWLINDFAAASGTSCWQLLSACC
jgi:preprotein translocase subunit SecY